MTETTIDGIRYYQKESGQLIMADRYDLMFKPCHGLKPKGKKFKGENAAKSRRWRSKK